MSTIDVNDANFESEVINSKIPVIVDIWAPWCVATDSLIFKDRRKFVIANSINKKDELLVYNGKKILHSEVLYSKTTSKGGHCKSITTENQRNLKVTDDHLLYTSKGWKRADTLKPGDSVAVYPISPVPESNSFNKEKIKNKVIIAESDFKKLNGKMSEKHIKLIKELRLLPLNYDNSKLYIISRLVGALFSDGSLYRNDKNHYYCAEFFLGEKEDVKELTSDLKELGFEFHIKRRINKFKIDGRDIKISTYRVRVMSGAFWLLMSALGVPTGKKTDLKYKLPKWLGDAPIQIKREFISAYIGGDGPSITIKVISRGKRGFYNGLGINDIEFYKKDELSGNGIIFAKQISKLLEEQGVKIRKIFLDKEKYASKNGGHSRPIHIAISSSFESAYALSSIGYAYSWNKQKQANYVKEFLELRIQKRKIWKAKYNNAVELFKDNLGIKEISSRLGISYSTAVGWLKYDNAPTVNYTYDRYDKWLKDSTRNLSGGLVWEKIEDINDVYLKSVQVLTINKYYNFIANGFLVHNCGPCRLFDPILKEVANDYEGKVKFVKINADENEKTVMRFNVSSIPTTLFIQNGQLKAMNVGAVPKETLKKWISQNL